MRISQRRHDGRATTSSLIRSLQRVLSIAVQHLALLVLLPSPPIATSFSVIVVLLSRSSRQGPLRPLLPSPRPITTTIRMMSNSEEEEEAGAVVPGVPEATPAVNVPAPPAATTTAAVVSAEARALFCETPLLYSAPLSKLATRKKSTAAAAGGGNDYHFEGTTTTPTTAVVADNDHVDVDVYIKLDCLQPSGSFKDRGMAHLITTLRQKNGCRRIVSSSGGNAGLAAATVARRLLASTTGDDDDDYTTMDCTVVVPETTKPHVIAKLQNDLAATVIVHGSVWNEADAYARYLVEQDTTGQTAYVPPYEHELLWTGHSTVVDEIYQQLQHGGGGGINTAASTTTTTTTTKLQPDAIVVSVGGGGLLCGVLEGLRRQHHHDDDIADDENSKSSPCHVIAAETVGASSFAQAYQQGTLVTLPSITSIATSLGALQVSPSALSRAMDYGTPVSTAVCTDAQAIHACWQFAQDHRLLVEPACGAALAVIYSHLYDFSSLSLNNTNRVVVVVEICGGSGVNLDLLQGWRNEYLLPPQESK